MNEQDISTETNVVTITRGGFLYRVINEIIVDIAGEGFLSESMRKILQRGIEDYKCIGEVILFLVKDNKRMAQIEIEIDRDRHQLNIKQDGETMTIKKDTPILDQLSLAVAQIVELFRGFREKKMVDNFSLVFRYGPGVDREEYNRKLNTRSVGMPAWHRDGVSDIGEYLKQKTKELENGNHASSDHFNSFDKDEDNIAIIFTPEILNELTIRTKIIKSVIDMNDDDLDIPF